MPAKIRNLRAARQHLRDERGERTAVAAGRGSADIFDRNERPRGLRFTMVAVPFVAHARSEQVRGQVLPFVNARACIISKHY